MRIDGLTRGPIVLGGERSTLSDAANDTRGDLFLVRRQSLLEHPPFKRSKLAEVCLDVAALFFGFLLLSVTAIGIAASLFILLFVAV